MDFDTLYEQNEKYVMSLLRHIYNKEDKLDLSQEAWIIIWQKLDTIEPGKEKAFIKKVVYNVIGNYITKSKRNKELMEKLKLLTEYGMTEEPSQYMELMEYLEQNLEDWEYQMLIYYLMGMNQTEIAKKMHTTQSKISSKLKMVLNKTRYLVSQEERLNKN